MGGGEAGGAVVTGGDDTGGGDAVTGAAGSDAVSAGSSLGSGFGFGLRTRAGSASTSPRVDSPVVPEATFSCSAGEPGAPVPGLACPVLLSAYATASATTKAAAAARSALRFSSEGI